MPRSKGNLMTHVGFAVGIVAIAIGSVWAQTPTTLPATDPGFDRHHPGAPRGKVEAISYESKATGGPRRAVVYTPSGYSSARAYPVLYLLHGAGHDEDAWVRGGKADAILDNLYSGGQCVAMIIVMPRGFAVRAGQPTPTTMPAKMLQGTGAFEDDLLGDLIPFVESHYSVKADPDHRAIAGLSMGGGQALRIGLAHRDQFAWIAGFSSAPVGMPVEPFLTNPTQVNHQLHLLWLSCGDKDFWMWPNSGLHVMLAEKGIVHRWQIDSGGHDWRVWKGDLFHLAPLLFRDD